MKQAGTVPKRLPGESDKAYDKRLAEWARDDSVRSKADLREFKTATFHFAPEREQSSKV